MTPTNKFDGRKFHNRTNFIKWLNELPKTNSFNFFDIHNCIFVTWAKACGAPDTWHASSGYLVTDRDYINFYEWMVRLEHSITELNVNFTVEQVLSLESLKSPLEAAV